MNRPIALDCRFFLGDRPCAWHKKEGVICQCEYYEKTQGELLLIKLDAMGDVLRTTCLLPLLTRRWPQLRVCWVTRAESVPLLENNPHVSRVVTYGPDALAYVSARRFARVINLDTGQLSTSLATLAKADEKMGYVLSSDGQIRPTNSAAEDWLRLGVFDDLKRENQQTYQQRMCAILGLADKHLSYSLSLTEEESEAGKKHLSGMGVDLRRPVVGVHTGGGGRWKLKQWHADRFATLIERLATRTNGPQVVLFGGPLERQLNEELAGRVQNSVFDTGCDNPVRHFAALVQCCSVMLSGDSLAMHIALATGARPVVLFGPTSHAEIELFGRGEKVIPELDCLVCYKNDCDFQPNCMDMISVGAVEAAVLRQLALA